MLNVNFNQFKSGYLKKQNQVLFFSINTKGEQEIINLINNLLIEKNSFVFESVEKGKIKGRYTIFGRNPDKIWEFNNNRCQILTGNKKKILIGNPKENIEKIIEEFKFNTPKKLPNICSLISGYFAIIIASSGVLSVIDCHISSVKNGIKGCNIFKLSSKIAITSL